MATLISAVMQSCNKDRATAIEYIQDEVNNIKCCIKNGCGHGIFNLIQEACDNLGIEYDYEIELIGLASGAISLPER